MATARHLRRWRARPLRHPDRLARAYWLAVTVLYREVPLPESQIVRDLPYVNGTVRDRTKHRLDLFVPAGRGWPMVVFVHGGGWREGDKGVTVGSADVYGNIGRYLASHGIGASIINYRLLPAVTWREQIEDVAHAVVAERDDWQREASPMRFIDAGAPPFLVIYSGGESTPLQRQSQLLHERLRAAGVPAQLVEVPGGGHERIVISLSRDDENAGPAITGFVQGERARGPDRGQAMGTVPVADRRERDSPPRGVRRAP